MNPKFWDGNKFLSSLNLLVRKIETTDEEEAGTRGKKRCWGDRDTMQNYISIFKYEDKA